MHQDSFAIKTIKYAYSGFMLFALLFTMSGCTSTSTASEPARQDPDWPFQHIVVDPSPTATYRMNDIAIGDINGDGQLDIWTSGRGAGDNAYQMVWYKGPDWQRYPIAPGDIKYGNLGDVDGDGDLDVVAGQEWFENTGQPEQPDWPRYSLGFSQEPDVVFLGDLNGDDRLDVVFTDKDSVYWLPGPEDPTGAWTTYEIAAWNDRTGGALADIDQDGDLDVLWGNAWIETPDEPTQTPWPVHVIDESWPVAARGAVADLNGDGRPDVALSGEETNDGVVWYEGPLDPRTGQWGRHDVVRNDYEGVHSLQFADFDQDGDLDLFVGEMHHGDDPDKVTVFENVDAVADIWNKHIIDTIGTHNAKVGDMNGDGLPDIVGKNYQAGAIPLQVDLWVNQLAASGEPASQAGSPLPVDRWEKHIIDDDRPWRSVFIDGGDVNGDGLPDIVTGGWWYANPGNASGDWTRHDIGGELYNMAAVHDFDGDGDLDILGTNGMEIGNTFSWAENDGTGAFTLHTNIPQPEGDFLQGARVGRLVPDGEMVVALSWHNETSTQLFHIPSPPTDDWIWEAISPTTTGEQVALNDIDRDGDTDIHLGTFWLRNDGDTWTTFEAVTPGDPDADPDRVELADMDGDGDLDVVIGSEHANRLVWGEAPDDPESAWTEHVISTDHLAMSMDVGDLDRDGDPDIVIGEHTSNGRVFIYQNDGQGQNWTATQIDGGMEHHVGTQLIDIDRDGDLDIMSIGWNHDQVVLYENLAIEGGDEVMPAAPPPTPTPEATLPPDVSPTESSGRVTDGLVSLYTFDEGHGAIVSDVSGVDPVLELTIDSQAGMAWLPGALAVTAPTVIGSSGPATKLTEAIQASNAITIEAWIQPANTSMTGPARIVTLSSDVHNRNFTLGQDLSQVDIRLRTTDTSSNGQPSLTSSRGALATGEPVHIVFTHDADGNEHLYVNGTEIASRMLTGDFSTWQAGFQFVLANETDGSRPWTGEYYLVAVYSRALGDEEIQQNLGAGPFWTPTAYGAQ